MAVVSLIKPTSPLVRGAISSVDLVNYTPLDNVTMTVDIGGTSYVCSIEENLKNKVSFIVPLNVPATTVASLIMNAYDNPAVVDTNNNPTISNQQFVVNESTNLIIDMGLYAADLDNDSLSYTISDMTHLTNGSTPAEFVFNASTAGVYTFTVTVSDGNGGTANALFTVTVNSVAVNNPPVISDQLLTVTAGSNVEVILGPLQDQDGDLLAYSFTGATGGVAGDTPNKIIFNAISMGNRTISVEADDGRGGTDTATVTIVVESPNGVTNNYVLGYNAIEPVYGSGMPTKYTTVIDPTTDCPLTRIVDASTDMQQSTQSVNGYSRYSQENSDGTLFLAQGTNSTSSTILDVATGNVVAYLAYDDSGTNTHTIGMAHEMRWDKTGNHPNRIYFVNGMSLYQIDDVTQNNNTTRANPTRSVVKDFTNEIIWPSAAAGMSKKVYNDQEGDCSLDCDHWAFMAGYYDNTTWRCAAIIHYQISTDTTHVMYPADLAGSNMDAFKNDPYFPKRPNMVEVSPLGSGIVIHTGRPFTGWFENTIGTWFDGPWLWPLDFDWATNPPIKISIDETHSGWAWAPDGRELFVSQDNRRDKLIAVYITGANKGYPLPYNTVPSDDSGDGCIDFANHVDLDYTGFHFVQMPQSKKGWIAVSMYSNSDEPMDDQIVMFEIKPIEESPRIWRISPMYSKYTGQYFDEAPASINMSGDSIYISQNWGNGNGTSNELFRYDLPSDWLEHLNAGNIVYGADILINGIEVV